jgi:hypothetical protein
MRLTAMPTVLVAVALIIAGCGSSSSTATSSSASAPGTTSTTATSAAKSTTTAASAPSFSSASNCQQLMGLGSKYGQAISAATTGGKFNLQAVVGLYQSLANAAPAAIRPDLQQTAQAMVSFAATLSRAGYKPGQVPTAAETAALQAASKQFTQPKFRAAAQHLSTWVRQNCG